MASQSAGGLVSDGKAVPSICILKEQQARVLVMLQTGMPNIKFQQDLRPWELKAVGMDNVSNEGEHCNTSVLYFRMAKEANGCLVASAPELGLGKVLFTSCGE